MIPVRLSMRNFMCYREDVPPLHFGGIHLACLSGDNGNGKSAIIDAMTWALWGQARAKSDDDLIAIGQAETQVEFDFMVARQLYRIIRKHARTKRKTGSGQTILEFQVDTGNGFKAISGEKIIQTQKKIIDVLHMDYETFINSAYLRQGHADQFTRQDPAKRKEVLGTILGLAIYDELEEKARVLAKEQETGKLALESAIKAIDDELARKPAYEAELEQAQARLSGIEAGVRDREARLSDMRRKRDALESRQTQLDELEARLGKTSQDLETWQQQLAQCHSRIGEYEEVIGRRAAIEAGYGDYTRAKKIYEELDFKSQQSTKLEKQGNQLSKKITEAGHALNTEHAVVQREINNLEARAQKLAELKNQRQQAQLQMQQLAASETGLKQKEEAVHGLQSQLNHIDSEKARLEKEINELAEKLDLISTQTGGKCPLCETELSLEGLRLIGSKYAEEKQAKSDLLKSNQADLRNKKAELDPAQKEASRLESWLEQEKAKAQGHISLIASQITEAEEAEKQLAALRKSRGEIEQRLAGKDFAVTEQQALAAIETELASLGYDPARHEQVRQELRKLEPYEHDRRQLEEAAKLISREKETAARAEEAARGLRHSLEVDSLKKDSLTAELASRPGLLQDLAVAEVEYRDLTAQLSRAQQTVGSVTEKIQRCLELEVKRKEQTDRLSVTAREEGIYKELAEAFGKKGIQALIIETALPEIETEANLLLGRMTDNRMHVKFDTQRPKKGGGLMETLDINIADELGTRNYEMFSGGEAFRINFAVRIALSRLLARRAGAPLPTLIIDEGFGTQDATGVEKLKEAINSIQGDFEMILVITHIEELRDAFPTRIDVVKTAAGSTISVN